jgi:hypothetical protein
METNNPYAPPKTAVDDVSSGVAPPRPPEVTRAVQLCWIAVALGFIAAIVRAVQMPIDGLSGTTLIVMTALSWTVGLLIVWWILSSIGKGRNWARIVQLVLVIFGLLGSVMLFVTPALTVILYVCYAVQMALNVWGIVLLFSAPANAWFRAMKEF